MPTRTRAIAKEIVDGLREELRGCSPEYLPGVRCLFVSGSFLRGDWLNCNSDLDLAVLFSNGASEQSSGYKRVLAQSNRILAGRDFPSHTPGGIDWCTLESFPTRPEEVRTISGYFPFHIFLFDFLKYSQILWGEDFRRHMPGPPHPASLARKWLDAILTRLAQLQGSDILQQKAAFNAYKAIVITQLVFGEQTLDKTRILNLFQTNVPDFPMKADGEELVRQYLGAVYPERMPHLRSPDHYQSLIRELRDLVH